MKALNAFTRPRDFKGVPSIPASFRISGSILHFWSPFGEGALQVDEAAAGQGNAIKKRDDMHKMAQANRAFAHFRW